ncbi:MAG: ATP-binding protein [Nanoarchaeota archaeon]|nr:ATP-binding protein [Nanoarchaeota archaeon]
MDFKRDLYFTLLREKDSKKVSIIIGPRQVGKTTILKQLAHELKGVYLDLDVLENFEKVNTYSNCISYLKLQGYEENSSKNFYVFLDEFQRYSTMSKIFKNIYDNHQNIKIYASGSSSLAILNSIQESLAGRKFVHHLYSLSFEEFLRLKNFDINVFNKYKSLELEFSHLNSNFIELFEEYLIYGGYIEVTLQEKAEKVRYLESIFDLFIKRELRDYLQVEEIVGVKRLIEYIAINNGGKLNVLDVSEQLKISQHMVLKYLEILEETFVIKIVRPYFTNKSKELVKMFKVYFIDSGVCNHFQKNFNGVHLRQDKGSLLESFLLLQLLYKYNKISYWQDKKGSEIDFIIEDNKKLIGYKLKYKTSLKSSDFKNIEKISKMYEGDFKLLSFARQDLKKTFFPFNVK